MPHGPTYFDHNGPCIYCGSSNTKQSDEHIVPFSLGGVHVIRNASCKTCADITSKFERRVAREMWGDARTAFDAPTQHPKNRKKEIGTNLNGNSDEINVPAGEYPAGFVFYKMSAPGILQGSSEDEDISRSWTMVVIDDDNRRKTFFEEHGANPTLKFRHDPQAFGQLLAKVGYCHFLTILNVDDFNPICLPYILGEKSNVSYIVGGVDTNPSPIPELGYVLHGRGFVISENRLLLIASIRLYSNTHSPEYEVVVGEVCGLDNITDVLKKLT